MTPRPDNAFLTTQWTRVLQARGRSDEALVALSELCEAYYKPVFAFIRHTTKNEDHARDLTQEFFARLLAKDAFSKLDPARGRFRSYILAAVKNFLHDERDRELAAKRNPPQPLQSLHSDTTSTTLAECQFADPNALPPDVEFDRKWAFSLLECALTALAAEHRVDGKENLFETLKPWLTGEQEGVSQASAAKVLGMNEPAVKVAIHRLRRRFRDHVKSQIAATLPEPDLALVADEMSYLISILR